MPLDSSLLATVKITRLHREKITRVYSGKARKCCCGCAGKYSETPRQINRVATIIEKNMTRAQWLDTCVFVDVEARTYTVYFDR